MDATCTIQNSIHVFSLVHKYVSRILGTYQRENTEGLHKMFMPGDVPEFKDISDRYYEEYAAINEYRNQCKDKALELFGKWFWHLWD